MRKFIWISIGIVIAVFVAFGAVVFHEIDEVVTRQQVDKAMAIVRKDFVDQNLTEQEIQLALYKIMLEAEARVDGSWSDKDFDPATASSKAAEVMGKWEKRRRNKGTLKPVSNIKQTRFGKVINAQFVPVNLTSMENLDKLNPYRLMHVTYLVPRADFRNSDGNPVSDADLKESMKSRMDIFGEVECRFLQITLADKCAVGRTRTWYLVLKEDGQDVGYIRIAIKLKFTQKDDLGKVEKASALRYSSTTAIVYPKRIFKFDLHDPDETAAMRIGAYKKMVELCRDMRQVIGNCAITKGSVSTTGSGMTNANAIYLDSSVDLGALHNAE